MNRERLEELNNLREEIILTEHVIDELEREYKSIVEAGIKNKYVTIQLSREQMSNFIELEKKMLKSLDEKLGEY